jgi:hypothetical protein
MLETMEFRLNARSSARSILAVAAGWAIWLVYQAVSRPLVNTLLFPWTYKMRSLFGFSTPHGFGWWIIWIAVRVFSGWVVARLNREHAHGTVFVFACSVLLWKAQVLPWTLHLLLTADDPRYRLESVNELMSVIVPFCSILLGGLWGTRVRVSAQPASAMG